MAVAAVEAGRLGAALHAEVTRLPAKYRAPVVLCYFEGRTHDEAAAALDWPVGTVRCRLSRARELLRSRLTRRGLAPAVAARRGVAGPAARAEVPAALVRATLDAAVRGRADSSRSRTGRCRLRGLLAARLRISGGRAGPGRDGRRPGRSSSAVRRHRPHRTHDRSARCRSRSDVQPSPRSIARRPAADARPARLGISGVPSWRPGQPGPLQPRRQDPDHARLEARRLRLGRGHGPAAPPDATLGRPLRADRPLARRHDPGDDRAEPRLPAPALGRRHRPRAAAMAPGQGLRLRFPRFHRRRPDPDHARKPVRREGPSNRGGSSSCGT